MDARSTFKEHATEWQRGLKWNIGLLYLKVFFLLIDIIYQRGVVEGSPPITKFSELRSIIVDKDNRLDSFFNEIEADACLYGKEKRKFNVLE